ncbi:MAG: Mut7-C RNAse domain-containing protein [Candidatus Aminicenantes bacterium]|nr:Mut7-C RNAse domain-containing protein [Candidatus Aminicenantes bacterium]
MKFAVDCMLGKLAKWLKILGFDTVFFSRIEDDELLELTVREGRILLTRDTGFMEKAARRNAHTLFVESEEWPDQVRQVLSSFNLREKCRPYSRCIPCNASLKDLSREKARNLVSPFVFKKGKSFALCPICGRIFWKGTHHEDMEKKLDKLLNQVDQDG